MKTCPSCHQTYPGDGPEFCTNDGTPLVNAESSYPNPGAMPGSGGGQWQAQGGQYTPPPPAWDQQTPPGWSGYPPPPQGQYPPPPGSQYPPPAGSGYPPYGYGAPQTGRAGLSKAAMITGIGALGCFILAVLLAVIGASNGRSSLRDMLPIIGILSLISLLVGLTAVVLGIITVSQSSRNPAMSKVQGILGICFGAIPILLWFVGIASGSRMRF